MDVAPTEHVACWFAQGCAAVDQLRFRTAGRVEGVLGDDAELTAAVLAAQDGDEDAFRAVYRTVHPRLLGYIRTLVGEPDAEDVASEAWLQSRATGATFRGDAERSTELGRLVIGRATSRGSPRTFGSAHRRGRDTFPRSRPRPLLTTSPGHQ
ncbi:hypothetical protein SBADM41S_00523 [Streptomyces badius]